MYSTSSQGTTPRPTSSGDSRATRDRHNYQNSPCHGESESVRILIVTASDELADELRDCVLREWAAPQIRMTHLATSGIRVARELQPCVTILDAAAIERCGQKAIARLRQINDAPVILVGSETQARLKRRYHQVPPQRILATPLETGILVKTIREALEKS